MTQPTIDEIVAQADALYHDVDLHSVQRWRDEAPGRKAIGYLPIYVPRELIAAAGMLPVGILGARGQIEIIRGDAYFQSYICQIPRSTVEMALTGRLAALDGFLFPSTCDVIRNLSGMWKVLFPDRYVHYLDVPQNFDPAVGGRFYQHELRGVYADLCRLSGQLQSDDALRRAIADYNDNRAALDALMELRNQQPWRAPLLETYLILYAGNLLPVAAHTQLVRDYIAAALGSDRRQRDHARVVVVGAFCEQPPLGLIRTLELAGCYIVWDDLSLGRRYLQQPVADTGDPVAALADAFLRHGVSTATRYEPDRPKGEALLDTVKRTHAEGVIFAAPSFCDPALLEQPMLQDALDRAGVPWTAFKYAENLGQFQVIREQAGTFADSIKLWSDA